MEGSDKEEQLAYMGEFERATLAWLLEDYPDAEELLESAKGYTLVHQNVTKVPIVGAGGGYGMTYDRTNDERVYFRVRRLDLGAGWGVRNYRVVFLFDDQEVLDGFKSSGLEFGAGAEATAKAGDSGAAAAAATSGQGFEMYTLTTAGVSATLTLRALRYRTVDL